MVDVSFRKRYKFLRVVNNNVIDLPCPPNLTVWWNFGSLLGVFLVSQILTGLLLACHYMPSSDGAFSSVMHIMRDVQYGWIIRFVHANGASFFFMFLYAHIGRGLYYGSYFNLAGWNVGVVLLLMSMSIAFTGYVLPWGQMSYWGATVITNMFSAIPVVGNNIVEWMWGGYVVCDATLKRFFVFHFIMPLIMVVVVCVHLVYLHEMGASNPLGVSTYSVPFHPYYTWKDLVGVSVAWFGLSVVCFFLPYVFMDPTNFFPANPMKTPRHIQPEWYFLFAYSVLRAVPNKAGGIVALLLSVMVLFLVPFIHTGKFRGLAYYPCCRVLFWCFVCNFLFLTWVGSMDVKEPFIFAGQVSTCLYLSYFVLFPILMIVEDWFLSSEGLGSFFKRWFLKMVGASKKKRAMVFWG
uniref:Cytochrome b n=1 Tax=Tegillarca granosa TaxID=220873 RepID=A0A0A7CJD0_TEGGR|nr:cytochrome b [Tegillarca granosa]AID49104.1 cytochrome b [Tegillarca granosa]